MSLIILGKDNQEYILNKIKLQNMKKTLTVNLNNTVYHIDEDAYESLQEYLNSLRNHFAEEEGAEEILSDIEARIAEII